MKRSKSPLLSLGSLFLLLMVGTAVALPPRITWTPNPLVTEEIAPGEERSYEVTLKNTAYLPILAAYQLRIVAEGAIVPYVTITQPKFPSTFKRGQAVKFSMKVSVPDDSPPGTLEGTLVLKRIIRSKVVDVWRAEVLPVKVTVTTDTEFLIPIEGGVAELPGIARVVFSADSFTTDTLVKLFITSTAEVQSNFAEFASIFRPTERLPYEVRINVGAEPPSGDFVPVVINLPDSFVVPDGYSPEGFTIIRSTGGEEVVEGFTLVESSFDPATRELTIQVPGAAFSKSFTGDETYEAIITVAPTPGGASSVVAPTVQSLLISPLQTSRSASKPIYYDYDEYAAEHDYGGPELPAAARLSPLATLVAEAALTAEATTTNECKAAAIACPVDGGCTVTSPYQEARANPAKGGVVEPHLGVDLRAANGTVIRAASDGQVERSYLSTSYGETIIVRHDDGSATLYAHLETRDKNVGDRVTKGDQIGLSDNTGTSTGPHLHFEYVPNGEIIRSKQRIDPFACIGAASGSITLSDDGPAADDAFSATLDGVFLGSTTLGASNTLAVSNLLPGAKTLRVTFIDQTPPGSTGVGTLQVTLSDGLTFSDGTTSKSEILFLVGDFLDFTIIVP